MSDAPTATTSLNPSFPALVDVTCVAGRRVRDGDGNLLPEDYVLRGQTRDSYWLRLAQDGDVTLDEAVMPEAPAPEAPAPQAASAEISTTQILPELPRSRRGGPEQIATTA